MKKLFSRIENTFDSQQGFAGKAFNVGRHTVTVEETIAEGEIMCQWQQRRQVFHQTSYTTVTNNATCFRGDYCL